MLGVQNTHTHYVQIAVIEGKKKNINVAGDSKLLNCTFTQTLYI